MPSENSKPEPKIADKQKSMAELYPDLPSLPDMPGRPRYCPLASTLGDLRYCHPPFPDLPDEIDIALDNQGQEMIKVGKKMDREPAFQEKN